MCYLDITRYNCSISSITGLLSSTPGLQITGKTQLMQIPEETTLVRNGSYVEFSCMSGYTNVGGNLNVKCINGSWTQAPKCVPVSQVTMVSSTCHYSTSMLNITNGYAADLNGLVFTAESKAASGSFIDYQCARSYTLKGNSRMICENGTWSAQPVCKSKYRE